MTALVIIAGVLAGMLTYDGRIPRPLVGIVAAVLLVVVAYVVLRRADRVERGAS